MLIEERRRGKKGCVDAVPHYRLCCVKQTEGWRRRRKKEEESDSTH
jgi:hypothetical protein